MHPNRQFRAMPSCLHVLLCVSRPLCSPPGGGDCHFGYVPLGGGGTIARRWLLFKGGVPFTASMGVFRSMVHDEGASNE